MAKQQPTLHVTNWGSRKLHGPGRRWTTMARPRRWEQGDGVCADLVPPEEWVVAVRSGELPWEEFRERYAEVARSLLADGRLGPGALEARARGGVRELVRDGDTLCCACSREAAAQGQCHRVLAAAVLAEAGWRVVLDGQELASGAAG